ncbi:MAG: DUF2442 domain-containing protein [Cyclobacteriaceae bacterium]
MNEVIAIQLMGHFFVKVKFLDGVEKTVNLRPLLGKGFTKELLDQEEFNKVFIEPGGGLAWPNGYDICPNYLKEFEDVSEDTFA